jgi:hypothetical protein
MATSGEAVVRYTVNTYCTEPVTLLSMGDLVCNWEGECDAYVDRDNSVIFVCGNGHTNRTRTEEVGL